MERVKINSRVTLNYIECKQSKSDRLSVYFRDELNENTVTMNALLMPTLLCGCEKYPDMKSISIKLQELYGAAVVSTNQKRGNEQLFGITTAFINRRFTLEGEDTLREMAELLFSLLQKPLLQKGVFRKDYVEIEKNNLITDIRAEINDKASFARKQCLKAMCEGDSFTVSATEEQAKKVTPQSLFSNYTRVMGECSVEIFYAGIEPKERVEGILSSLVAFADTAPKNIASARKILPGKEVKNITEKMKVTQGKLAMGFTTDITCRDKDFVAMALCIAMYGSTPTSKLFMNVREKLSLCYTVSASFVGAKGIMTVMAGIDFAKKETAQNEILQQLQCVKDNNFTDEELELSRNYMVSLLRTVPDSPDDLVTWWLAGVVQGTDDSPEDRIKAYMSVTREDIVRVASHIQLNTVYFLDGKEAKR